MPSIEISNLSTQQTEDLLDDVAKKYQREKKDKKINNFTDEEKRKILLEAAEEKEREQEQANKPKFVKFVNGLSKLIFGHLYFWLWLYVIYNIASPSLNSDLVHYKVKQFYENSKQYNQMKNMQAIYNLCTSNAKAAFDATKPGSLQALNAEQQRLSCANIINRQNMIIPLWQLDKYNDFYKLDKTTIDNAKKASRAIMDDMGISPETNAKLGQILFVLQQQLTEKAKKIYQ